MKAFLKSVGTASVVNKFAKEYATRTALEVGDIVLFPASLSHYTIPFESDEERIVLAFDVKPGDRVAEY